jgi:membrane protein YqaA with SNARE-associated domain
VRTDLGGRNGSRTGQGSPSGRRIVLILCEAALVLGLLVVWVSSESVRESTSLVVLFFYSFPSEFLVGLVPHEPVLIYYGFHHPASVVALVAVVSTVMAEGLNYSLFGLFYGMEGFRRALDRKTVRRLINLFNRFPFSAILFAGFTPVPFFPIRFLVVLTEYPVWKYLLGVFLSRAPRFYLLALFGAFFEVPAPVLGGIFLAMLLVVNLPSLANVLNGSRAGAGPVPRLGNEKAG